MSESFQIPLADLKEWFQNEIAPFVEPLKDKGKNLLDEIRNRLDDIRENGVRIFVKSDREIQKSNPKTYRCAKAANKMSKNISNKIDQVVVPDDISYENFRLLLGDLEKTLAAIEHERRVWYRRISPYFILDRRRLDVAIKKAEGSVQELRNFLLQKYAKLKAAENTLAMIDKLSRLIEASQNVQERITQTKTRLKLLEEKIQENEQKFASIQSKAELNELSKLEQKIRDLKAKVKYNLRHLQKPFYKMQSLARRAQVAVLPDEMRKLEQYMKNPFEALASEEEGHPMLKRLVQKLDDTIRQGKLKLKTARLRKAREQIDSILKKDILTNLHNHCLETISKKKQLLTSETVATTREEMKRLEATLQELRTEKESTDLRIKSLEEKHQEMLEKIKAQKNELEKSIFKLTGKKVQVVFTSDS